MISGLWEFGKAYWSLKQPLQKADLYRAIAGFPTLLNLTF